MFDFAIHFILIEEADNGMVDNINRLSPSQFLMSVRATQRDEMYDSKGRYYTWNNNRFSWFTGEGKIPQLNNTSIKYYYVAF